MKSEASYTSNECISIIKNPYGSEIGGHNKQY